MSWKQWEEGRNPVFDLLVACQYHVGMMDRFNGLLLVESSRAVSSRSNLAAFQSQLWSRFAMHTRRSQSALRRLLHGVDSKNPATFRALQKNDTRLKSLDNDIESFLKAFAGCEVTQTDFSNFVYGIKAKTEVWLIRLVRDFHEHCPGQDQPHSFGELLVLPAGCSEPLWEYLRVLSPGDTAAVAMATQCEESAQMVKEAVTSMSRARIAPATQRLFLDMCLYACCVRCDRFSTVVKNCLTLLPDVSSLLSDDPQRDIVHSRLAILRTFFLQRPWKALSFDACA